MIMYVTGDCFQMQAGAGEQKGTHFYVTFWESFCPYPGVGVSSILGLLKGKGFKFLERYIEGYLLFYIWAPPCPWRL